MAATIIWSGIHTKLLTRLGRSGQAEWFIPELGWSMRRGDQKRSAARFLETGTGFASAKLSEVRSSRR